MMRFTKIAAAMLIATVASAAGLDFEIYRSRVEPIFLRKRPGHARCVTCHAANSSAFHLEALAPQLLRLHSADQVRDFLRHAPRSAAAIV